MKPLKNIINEIKECLYLGLLILFFIFVFLVDWIDSRFDFLFDSDRKELRLERRAKHLDFFENNKYMY